MGNEQGTTALAFPFPMPSAARLDNLPFDAYSAPRQVATSAGHGATEEASGLGILPWAHRWLSQAICRKRYGVLFGQQMRQAFGA